MKRTTATTHLGFARAAISCLLLAVATALADTPDVVPGALLRHGNWNQDVGSYGIPQAWQSLPARSWPLDGWATFVIDSAKATLTVSPLSRTQAGEALKPIIEQLEAATDQGQDAASRASIADPQSDEGKRIPAYVRVPGLNWKPRTVELYRFRNGTPHLRPSLDHRFELTLNHRAFSFTLQNGLRTADGRPYGEGTQFSLDIEGRRYDYDLGGYGWDVRIEAIGDFDGDGLPDFLFQLGGSNSDYEALTLSSQARPGRNPPTAYLVAWGC